MSRNFLKIFVTILLTLAIGIWPCKSWSASSNFSSQNENAEVRIISSYFQDQSQQQKLLVGFHFKLNKGWKIYGKLDSSFTQPPTFDFSNSKNIDPKNFNISWPQAKIIEEKILDETITYPVYENEVIIPIEIKILDQNKPVDLKVKLTYGLCNEICIPVEQNLTLEIPSRDFDQKSLDLIQGFSKKLAENAKNKNEGKITLLKAILISFIGGLILNIMPCVLPVLSIKLLSIIHHSKSRIGKIRIAYFSTTTGILFCFLLFAGITATLKVLGNNIGWGIQFQNPYFLTFMVIILTVFTANLIGLFEINTGSFLSNIINRKIEKNAKKEDLLHVVISNFFSGILAVLLATPCSAPFLGTAISFAFTQDSTIIFIIFTFMALGLSSPYIILTFFPQLIKFLPKPGKWMIAVKNLMAGFLIATIIWLVYILSDNIGFISAMLVATFSILIFIWFKICSKFKIKKLTRLIVILIMTVLIMVIPTQLSRNFAVKEKSYDQLWIKFEEDKIASYVTQGKVVIVDISADWCLTCKLNKSLVLDSAEIVAILKQPNMVSMFGDLTKPNHKISEFMARHNRYAIPFNIVFGPKAPEGILVSELLNKKALIKIIESAK